MAKTEKGHGNGEIDSLACIKCNFKLLVWLFMSRRTVETCKRIGLGSIRVV